MRKPRTAPSYLVEAQPSAGHCTSQLHGTELFQRLFRPFQARFTSGALIANTGRRILVSRFSKGGSMFKRTDTVETTFKSATRQQESLLAPFEKKVLVAFARRMPAWVNSDHLTLIG